MGSWTESLMGSLPPGRVRRSEPFSTLTSWGVGGAAEVLVRPETEDEAETAIRLSSQAGVECRIIGAGSNLLVSDRGIGGMVLKAGAGFESVQFKGRQIVAGTSARLSVMAGECARRGLAGLEFAIGIPGSLGGAIATNAGAEGSQIGDRVQEVGVIRRSGEREIWDRRTLDFRYRASRLLEEPVFVLSATLELAKADRRRVEQRTDALLEKRRLQPKGRSAGSVFRNPDGDYAGRLLEKAGAKGMEIGGARVPQEHANWIITEVGASALDVLRLIKALQDRVLQESGTLLVPEVIFAGFDPGDPELPGGARLLGEIV